MGRKRKKVRWGHLHEISHLRRVPGKAWDKLETRLKHLSAWRRMHFPDVSPHGHLSVRMSGTRIKVRPSSNMSIKQKKSYIVRRGNL